MGGGGVVEWVEGGWLSGWRGVVEWVEGGG